MREPFPLSGWLVIGLLVAVAVLLLVGPHSQATSHRPFTVTEIDPTGNRYAGHWQYRAVAKTAPGGFSHWRDSPWHWRHYDQTAVDEEGVNCDETLKLFPADPNSPDTDVSADGGTVTVSIYQQISTVWVCFAFECDDGTYAYAKMKNDQTLATINSGTCGNALRRSGQPDQPAIDSTDSNQDSQLDPIGGGPDELDNPGGQNQEDPGTGQAGQSDPTGAEGQSGQANDQTGGQTEGQDSQQDQDDTADQTQTNQPPGSDSSADQTPSK